MRKRGEKRKDVYVSLKKKKTRVRHMRRVKGRSHFGEGRKRKGGGGGRHNYRMDQSCSLTLFLPGEGVP